MSLGPYSDDLGLTELNLLDTLSTAASINNGQAYEILKHVQRVKLPWCEIRTRFPGAEELTGQQFLAQICRVKNKRDELAKTGRKIQQLAEFLGQPFQLHVSQPRKRKLATPASSIDLPPASIPRLEAFNQDVQSITSKKFIDENVALQARNHELEKENKELKQELKDLKKVNEEITQRLKQLSLSRVGQDLKRKSKSATKWKNKYKKLSNTSKDSLVLQKKLKETHSLNQQLKRSQTKQEKRCKKYRHRGQEAEKGLRAKRCLETELVNKQQQLKKQHGEILYLEDQLEIVAAKETDMIPTKADGKTYTAEVRLSSEILQDSGVAQANCSATLRKIAKTLTGKDMDILPSYTTQNALTREMKALSKQQVRETLENTQRNTLKFDGTTKKSGHLVGVEASTETGDTVLLGMQLQSGGTASAYTKTIVAQSESVGLDLQQVSNTMTDRCITNHAIHRQLEALKGGDMQEFKCAMHPLDSMAKDCNKAVCDIEKKLLKEVKGAMPFTHRGESLSQATVRITAKLFHTTQYFSEDLHAHLVSQFGSGGALYYRYVGNRFHVFFLSSGMLHSYTTAVKEFFNDVSRPHNGVEMSIHNALNQPVIGVALRALGLVGKIVTGPWMRLVGQHLNILEMNPYFQEAHANLTTWSADASPLMVQDPPGVFHDVPVLKDRVLASLTTPTASNGEVQKLLETLLQCCLDVINRQLQTQLPGGAFWEPSAQLQREAKSCGPTNIGVERVFSGADAQMARAANAKPEFIESRVLFKLNKTGPWLIGQSEEERRSRIARSRLEGRQLLKQDRELREVLRVELQQRLTSLREAGQKKDNQTRGRFEGWLETVIGSGGLWAASEVDAVLSGVTKTQSRKLITAQINVRSKVLGTVVPKFAVTKASLPELVEHLQQVITLGVPDDHSDLVDILQKHDSIVGLDFNQKWSEDDGKAGEWCSGTVVEFLEDSSEYKMAYQQGEEICFITVDELLTDIVMGNLDLHYV